MERKEFLKSLGLGTVAFSLFTSCSPEAIGPSETTTVNEGETNTDCLSTLPETEGPFPIKDPASLERVNIIGDRSGVELDIEITILNKTQSCVPLAGIVVDIWHCDKDGYYSEYGGTGMQRVDYIDNHFLRGRQITDSNGKVAFTSIFPGWYQGRATHIHVHVYNENGTSLLVTQIAFPEGEKSAVVLVNAATNYGYSKGMNGYTYNGEDNVFSDGIETEMSNISGSISEGFSLKHNIIVTP